MEIHTIDLHFQGTPQAIAAFLIRGPRGPVLVETGPGSTLEALLAGLAELDCDPADIRDVLVTHIHLDHSGAAGWWARQGATIHVHPRGAKHLVDPSRLLSSAERIYGDRMGTLWGEVLAAPVDRVVAVEDGATLRVGGLEVRALDTPGHARHHLVYCVDDVAFAGDVAGIQIPGSRWIDLPAPPPEFDLEAWKATLAVLRGQGVREIYRTHFGPGDAPVEEDLMRFERVLEQGAEWVRQMLDRRLPRQDMVTEFAARMREAATAEGIDPSQRLAYELANPRAMSVDGIARYWEKRAAS